MGKDNYNGEPPGLENQRIKQTVGESNERFPSLEFSQLSL
ncbi:hypothetical protein X777_09350, partial [Ooceraea biroi]